MASNFIPDFVTSGNYPAFCRGAIQVNAAGKPFYNTSGGFNITSQACGAGSVTAFNWPAFYAADFNHLAYDPNVTYQPPTQADGTPLSSGVSTDSAGNQTSLKTVQTDPYNNPLSTVDLSVTVTVPLYCNTDWPIITNPVAIGEVGNAAGEYMAGAGAYCRINGTSYDQNANGAPAVVDDYNYPWPKVGAAAGAAGSANAAAYFWRQNATRQIWCDKTSPNWPQTCKGAWKCTAGGTPIFPPSQPQTCYLQSITTICTASTTTYSPTATCNTDPAYDLGGCVGPECLKCTATVTCTATADKSNGACHLTANGGPPGSGGSGAGCTCQARVARFPPARIFNRPRPPVPRENCRRRAA